MKLHENKSLFRDAIRFTADKMNMRDIYIEKDYWVTYALKIIFNNEIGKETIFKGGTALSKCYRIIERFSEDIDLVVLRREDESDSKMKNKLRKVNDVVNIVLPEVEIQGITNKKGMNRKTAHIYNKEFEGNYGQIKDVIVLESTWFGKNNPPYIIKPITSFIGNMLLDNNQKKMAEDNGLLSFEIQVLRPERTICEKIMSLVRFSYEENAIDMLKKKVRHIYDLHQLLKQKELNMFFKSTSFKDMLINVAEGDVVSFKNNNQWLKYHPNNAVIFKDIKNVWNSLKTDYQGDFKNLVYGFFPDEKDVFYTLLKLKHRLAEIKWTIHL